MKIFLNYFIPTFPLGAMYTFTIACKFVLFSQLAYTSTVPYANGSPFTCCAVSTA